jgi:hypothetical protein
MADNVPITAGTGTDIATDQVTTTLEHVQLFKLAISTDGSRTLVPADATNGLDVDVTRISGALPAGTNTLGGVLVTDGTNSLVIDTAHNDGESNTENHIDVSSKLMGYNGTTWDRLRSTTGNGLAVDVTRVQGQVTVGDGTNAISVDTAGTDAETNAVNQLHTQARQYKFNGTTWDRERGAVTVFKCSQYATAQTGTALWTPSSGLSVVVTALQIQSGGSIAGTCIVWFGASADTTYTRGTDGAIFDGEFVPNNTNKPGVVMTMPNPIRGTANYVLRVTTTNAQTVTINVWGYEI